MTLHSKIWAIGVLCLVLPFSGALMLGHIPGANSEHEVLRGLAKVFSALVERHGALFAGFAVMVIGLCCAAACLVWGDEARKSDGNSGDWFGDCGGGDGGGD